MCKIMDWLQGQEPERPSRKDQTEKPKPTFHEPTIKTLPGASATSRGRYRTRSGKARGLVVHYTAGRHGGRDKAANTMNYMVQEGLGCLIMDETGQIYMPGHFDLDTVAYHAGRSEWKGRKGISFHCMGMEIMCGGKLNQGKTWFGEMIPPAKRRDVYAQDNMKAGEYHKFTEAQEKALENFILWQLAVNPEFDIEWIVGHDEIAPARKEDPGGSLSMSMPEYRKHIRSLIS